MKLIKFFDLLILLIVLQSFAYSQENICIYFPVEPGKSWSYYRDNYHDTLTAIIDDSAVINNKSYYSFAPLGENINFPRYWMRPDSNKIYALNQQDSTEYLLFDMQAEENESWGIPPEIISPSTVPLNQCLLGRTIIMDSYSDTVFTQNRTFYNTIKFIHTDNPCADMGFLATWFARDFGIVQFSLNTIAGPITWKLKVNVPDTIQFTGTYSVTGNPCLSNPCPPSIVSIVSVNDTDYVITFHDFWFQGDFSWKGYTPSIDDSVSVKGLITNRMDIFGNPYYTIEIIDFTKFVVSGINDKEKPLRYSLEQNYPNPFNPVTTIGYSIKEKSNVKIIMLNVIGEEAAVILNEEKNTGYHTVIFNAGSLSSSVYFYRLQAGGFIETKKMILLK